ncbi:holo-ACP synthase [Candidatus Beckwithbacteria bacterium]|nr:holo-ACP synthase [Candidatus Beckwithbacteria bacterium]
MQVVKTGIDICQISRIKKLLDKPSFLQRVFTAAELEDKRPEHLAALFAAKEAFFKATQIKLQKLNEIEIKKDKNARPYLSFNPKNLKFKISSCDLSLSHDGDCAVACVVILAE